jgi:hypothetical protein
MARLANAQSPEALISAVVTQWQNPPSDSDSLESLVFLSASLRDARIVSAAQNAVQLQSNPQQARVAGLRTLLTFAIGRPNSVLSVAQITDADSLDLAGGVSGIESLSGAQPITVGVLTSLVSAMQSVSASDPSSAVRIAAARVRRYAAVAIAPKPELAYVCRTKFRVRNASDFVVEVEYAVAGTNETGRVVVDRRQSGTAYADAFFATDNYGSVTISTPSGELLGSATDSRIACPT